jgi:hypothetical protein
MPINFDLIFKVCVQQVHIADYVVTTGVLPGATQIPFNFEHVIAERSGHTSTLVALCHVTQRWNAARG